MLLLLGVLLLIGFVHPQDLDWESTCVTDPTGTPRIHLENHSPWNMKFLIKCYDSSFWVDVRPHTTETRVISFPWTLVATDCITQEYSDKTSMVYTYAYYDEGDNGAPQYEDFRYNHTWCSRQPGLLDDVRAYSTCMPNADGNLEFYFLNFFHEPAVIYFQCFDVYMDGLVPYWDNRTYTSQIAPRTRVRLEISVWRPELAEQLQRCVMDYDRDGFSYLHFAALDLPTTGKYYYVDTRIWCKNRQADDRPSAEVFVRCPPTKYDVPLLVLRSDLPAYAVAACRNGPKPFSTVNDVSATLQGTFSQDPDVTDCQFFKKVERDTYSVTIEVAMGQEGRELFLSGETQTVTCVYDDISGAETAVERVGKPLFPPEDTSVFKGKVYSGIFRVRILDVYNRETYLSSLASGRLVRLRVTENTQGVNGFRAHSCLAKNGITSYPILQNGCGDGIIIPRTSGFLTVGNVVYSPFFQVFRLRGGRNIWFDCLFALCPDGDCDGSSCAVEDYGFEVQNVGASN